MPDVCLVFLLHHPERLRHVRVFDEATDFGDYVDDRATAASLREAASRSFLPALKLLRDAAAKGGERVRFALCPSGPFLRSAERHHKVLLRSLQRLNDTGAVEWVCSPWDHSILSILPGERLAAQLHLHAQTLHRLFGARPTTAANTELIYDNAVARQAAAAGMKLVLCGHADRWLAGRTANRVYRAPGEPAIKVLARNVGLSDDWGVRFSDPSWACHPLKADTYVDWIAGSLRETEGTVCPIMLHLADLGLTHEKQSGVFAFARRVLGLLPTRALELVTPAQASERAPSTGAEDATDVLDVPRATSGWGPAFDLSPWLGNAMQSNALHLLRQVVNGASSRNKTDDEQTDARVSLCAADHLHAMRHAAGSRGTATERIGSIGAGDDRSALPAEERRRASPFDGPYDAYLDYTNALQHVLARDRSVE